MNSKRNLVCENHWQIKGYNSINVFIQKTEMDIVVIANETFKHADIAEFFLNAGIHVLVEKPIDVNIEKIKNLIKLAEVNNKLLGVVLQKRFDPKIRFLKKVIDRDELGKILFAKVDIFMHRNDDYFSSKYWVKNLSKVGGGVLIHQGIHSIDSILWLLNSKVEIVSGWISKNYRKMEIEDSGGCWAKLENNVAITIVSSVNVHP